MLGISFSEIILIGIIALIVFGPGEIPQIVTTIGKFIQNFRTLWQNTKVDLYHQSGLSVIQEKARVDMQNIYEHVVDEANTPNNLATDKIKTSHNDGMVNNSLPKDNATNLNQPELDLTYK